MNGQTFIKQLSNKLNSYLILINIMQMESDTLKGSNFFI